jgi:DNA-directed RNA polymerase specialized sigma24 family protein
MGSHKDLGAIRRWLYKEADWLVRWLRPNPTDLEDIVQETLLRFQRKWSDGARDGLDVGQTAWLRKTLSRVAMDWNRKRTRQKRHPAREQPMTWEQMADAFQNTDETPATVACKAEKAERLRAALKVFCFRRNGRNGPLE